MFSGPAMCQHAFWESETPPVTNSSITNSKSLSSSKHILKILTLLIAQEAADMHVCIPLTSVDSVDSG